MKQSAFFKRLTCSFLLVNLLATLILVIPLYQSHQKAQQKASIEATSLVNIMETTVSGLIEQIDIVLKTCAEETPLQLAKGVGQNSINAFLHRQFKHLPELNALRIADETGRVVYGVGPSLGTGVSVADRDYFIRARKDIVISY